MAKAFDQAGLDGGSLASVHARIRGIVYQADLTYNERKLILKRVGAW